jgi:hypothetical protein
VLESCDCREVVAEEAEPLSAVWRPHPAVWLLEKAVSPLLLLCIAVNAAW